MIQAQAQFSSQSPAHNPLDTSGKLGEHIVNDTGKNVHHHKDHPTSLEDELKEMKLLLQKVVREREEMKKQLVSRGEELKKLVKKSKERKMQDDLLASYQVALRSVRGLCEIIWQRIDPKDKALLGHHDIDDMADLRLWHLDKSRKNKCLIATQVYSKIPTAYRVFLEELYDAKRRFAAATALYIHPIVSIAHFHKFCTTSLRIDASTFKAIEKTLKEMEIMEIWDEDGCLERLFVD
jgi:hypothetical protein